uniref:Uncharacterized protein n=1 Tax=Solanum lycopersicum TaxID=4081 RepID=K4CL56_SOLLC
MASRNPQSKSLGYQSQRLSSSQSPYTNSNTLLHRFITGNPFFLCSCRSKGTSSSSKSSRIPSPFPLSNTI